MVYPCRGGKRARDSRALLPTRRNTLSKSYVMERERYDGADIVHLLHACSAQFDWHRLLERFGAHWRVLLNYLIRLLSRDRKSSEQCVFYPKVSRDEGIVNPLGRRAFHDVRCESRGGDLGGFSIHG